MKTYRFTIHGRRARTLEVRLNNHDEAQQYSDGLMRDNPGAGLVEWREVKHRNRAPRLVSLNPA